MPGRSSYAKGDRIRVVASAASPESSARLLSGMTGQVIGPHPFVSGWVKILLDRDAQLVHRDWSISVSYLEPE